MLSTLCILHGKGGCQADTFIAPSWRMSINSETILYPSHIHGPNSTYLHSEVNASYFQYMRENREKTPSTSGVTHGRVGRPAGIIIMHMVMESQHLIPISKQV